MAALASQCVLFVGRQQMQSAAHRYTGRRKALRVACIGWDPEGILRPPETGHITRRMIQKQFKTEEEQKLALKKLSEQQLEQRRAAREARVVPETEAGLVEFFMQTEAQEMEYEIARCRLRLNEQFLSHLSNEIATLKFKINRTQEVEDKLVELEALNKVLKEGIEAYDKFTVDLISAKASLVKIFESKNKRATLLEMVEKNELDRSLLVLLDENIVTANNAGQEQTVQFMKKIRSAVVKYITL